MPWQTTCIKLHFLNQSGRCNKGKRGWRSQKTTILGTQHAYRRQNKAPCFSYKEKSAVGSCSEFYLARTSTEDFGNSEISWASLETLMTLYSQFLHKVISWELLLTIKTLPETNWISWFWWSYLFLVILWWSYRSPSSKSWAQKGHFSNSIPSVRRFRVSL